MAANAKTAAAAAARAGHPPHPTAAQASRAAAIYDHALTTGFSRAFEVSAGIALLALFVTIAMVRNTRDETSASKPAPQAD